MSELHIKNRVLIYAPYGKDATLVANALHSAGVLCEHCSCLPSLLKALEEGAGALVTVEEALNREWFDALYTFIAHQPDWSDFPILVLTKPGSNPDWVQHAYDVLGNLTLLERPMRVPTLTSAVRSALRGRQRQYQICEAYQHKDEFLAMLAHELRNPLAPIGAAAQLLSLRPQDATMVLKTSQTIARQVRHMSHLIDDLLDMARLTRNLVAFASEQVDMRNAASEAVEQLESAMQAKQHRLNLRLPIRPVWVKGDPNRLVQVIANLLNNAVKYTLTGGSIEVILAVEKDSVVLEVSDDGMGIEPDLAPYIFDLFTQAKRTPDRTQGGLGLGLALVKLIANAHGGSVHLCSEGLGQGSTFTLRLPCLPADEVMRESVACREPIPKVPTQRILVVDDNQDAADMLCTVLREFGHEVVVAYDASAALDIARRLKPQVSLLDIGLPDMDGMALANRLRELPETATSLLIAVTGYGQDEDIRKSLAAGFNAHLVKPPDMDELQKLFNRS
ncbi:hybrid sensor histidine kinase/response regulator [Undibacterium sp. TC4M20W]|uniref:hybrid sensor histidine kinase/response regulator n=1 Tax=Undibacterium sp. TC4M20W TaxID=3413052 RepID=UPI003BF028F6